MKSMRGLFIFFPVRLFALLLLVFSLAVSSGASYAASEDIAPKAVSGDNLEHYSITPFPTGSVMRNPNSSVATYVQINPETAVRGDAVLNLWYSYSPIVIPEISTMTVSVNGTPIGSRILKVDGAPRSNWRIPIPAANFTEEVNEVEVAVIHRTIDGLCRDIDNDANWFIIRPETRLAFALEKSPDRLAYFPRPFTDNYTSEKTNTVVYLPDDYGSETLSQMMNLGTLLGRNSIQGYVPSRLLLRAGGPGRFDSDEIVLGRTAKWMPNEVVSADEVILSMRTLSNGRARLLIAASDDKGLAKGVEALSRPRLIRTFTSNYVRLASPLPVVASTARSVAGSKRELYTLADFGYDGDIEVAGAFHQEAQLFIPRPPNYRAAEGSYVDLHFRHSTVLDPKKSAVTVYVNDIPIRSQNLRLENANGGVLRAEIPKSELGNAFWNLRFAFYHDIGIIDCSKRYDDVAWSVVERGTSVFLKRGDIPYTPVWSNFPNDFHTDARGDIELTMLMLDKPDDRNLSTALRLAYYIGLNNAANIRWNVVDAEHARNFDASKAPGTVIVMGERDDKGWDAVEKYLSIRPRQGRYDVDDWLEVAPDLLDNFDIYQVGKIAADKWMYAFMYRSDSRLTNLLDFSLRAPIPLSGQVALVDREGKVTSFEQEQRTIEKRLPWFDYISLRLGGTAAVYALVLAGVILITVILMMLTMRKGRHSS